ncbi:DEAD-box ATP-dependent RNA helicase [Vigna angularis]|uniref:DEAD-box ATP-dependent RNA helicase n=1 Tax=Phaseolus angularis TaxID=3914 RepID=A0A8T0JUM1_PHAAN|nr:DEAD-box ATP-dependent RNA helicase [Vigna angularis]
MFPNFRDCHRLSLMLEVLDQEATALYSFKSQTQRLEALHQFKSGKVSVLLATDVASRGLDIPTVDLVINYDVPRFPRDYIHRVGRTARAGRGGLALSLVTQVFSAKNVAEMRMIDDGFEEKAKERKKQKLKMLAEKGLLKKNKRRKKNKEFSEQGKEVFGAKNVEEMKMGSIERETKTSAKRKRFVNEKKLNQRSKEFAQGKEKNRKKENRGIS